MLKNYFKTAFRYLWKYKLLSGINLTGLAVGFSVCYFAGLYVQFELSYDNFHEKADRIYRLVTDIKTSTGLDFQSTSAPMAPALKATFPEVEAATRVLLDYLIVQKGRDTSGEEKIAYADSSLFSVFTFPFISGNPQKALNAPFSLVLTESAANTYFGSTDCLGETLLLDRKYPAIITGVMRDVPNNAHFQVDILASMSTLLREWNPSMARNWKRFGFYTYLALPEHYDPAQLGEKLPSFVQQHMEQDQFKYTLSLEPLRSVYLEGKARGHRAGSSVSGNRDNLYIFSLIALLVLFIACFNFVNLSTAFSIQRSREIGVRKVLGASRRGLIIQFLTDAVLLGLLAFFLSLLLCVLSLPLFNQLVGKVISTNIFEHIHYIGLLFLFALVVGLFSGMYPAFFLSGFQPLSSLKGKFVSGYRGILLRKILVTSQFTIAIILVALTLIIYTQLHFMQNQELGFQKDHKLVLDFHFDEQVKNRAETIKQELLRIPGIEAATISSSLPGKANHQLLTTLENIDHEKQELLLNAYFVDDDFLGQYRMGIIAGRTFSKEFASDTSQSMVINESAAKSLGYTDPADAVGSPFRQGGQEGRVIGVIRDFHFQSFHEKVQPLTLRTNSSRFTFLTLNISSTNIPSTLAALENKWLDLAPGIPFGYFFADEAYNTLYEAEKRFGKLFICFATLNILVACLGLLGLTIFNTEQRTKEIGIRKVLGASVSSILFLLSKDYIKLILIACFIAIPVANYFISEWLQSFAYRIEVSWWLYAIPAALILIIALFAISGQTVKAARKNPVDSLRYE